MDSIVLTKREQEVQRILDEAREADRDLVPYFSLGVGELYSETFEVPNYDFLRFAMERIAHRNQVQIRQGVGPFRHEKIRFSYITGHHKEPEALREAIAAVKKARDEFQLVLSTHLEEMATKVDSVLES